MISVLATAGHFAIVFAQEEISTRRLFTLAGLALGVIVFVGFTLYGVLSPTQRALKKAKQGDTSGAEADLKALLQKKGASAGLHSALGRVYLIGGRPQDAVGELQKAVEMGSRGAATLNALGWSLVRTGRFEEALPVAEEANKKAREDFEVYCLYCGVLARNGRASEAASVYETVKTTAAQIQKMRPSAFQGDLAEKFDFARTQMSAAGHV